MNDILKFTGDFFESIGKYNNNFSNLRCWFYFLMTPYLTNFTQIVVILFYTVICLTDFLDGWVARRLKIESELGKILDPLADKILVLLFLPLLENASYYIIPCIYYFGA